jgi:hypothetical protein
VIRVHPASEVVAEVRLAVLEGRSSTARTAQVCDPYCDSPLGGSGYGDWTIGSGYAPGWLELRQAYGEHATTRSGGYGRGGGEVLE